MSWRNRAPRSVTDPYDAHDNPVFTPTDRRWLWRLESALAISAPMGSSLARLGSDLHEYLGETCEHHWIEYQASEWEHPETGEVMDTIPAHRQCIWCTKVEETQQESPGEVG